MIMNCIKYILSYTKKNADIVRKKLFEHLFAY